MRVFVLTGGGLSPSLNATIYGIAKAAKQRGWELIGGLYGWASLLQNGRQINLSDFNLEPLKNIGGTVLHSSRTNPMALVDGVVQIKDRLHELRIDAVIAIGGDDTMTTASELAREGLCVIGVPKTIDNDLSGTYCCPGYPTAAYRLANFTKAIRQDAAYALSRVYVIESLGMKAGWLAVSSIYGGADVIIPPENPVSIRRVLNLLEERYTENGNYATLVVAQEAHFDEPLERIPDRQLGEQYGHLRHSFICLSLKDKIQKELGIETKALYPGNYLESGPPIPLDRDLSIHAGEYALELVEQRASGQMVCILRPHEKTNELTIGNIALTAVIGVHNYHMVPTAFFDYNRFQPTPAFINYMEPILGPLPSQDGEYNRLTKLISAENKN